MFGKKQPRMQTDNLERTQPELARDVKLHASVNEAIASIDRFIAINNKSIGQVRALDMVAPRARFKGPGSEVLIVLEANLVMLEGLKAILVAGKTL